MKKVDAIKIISGYVYELNVEADECDEVADELLGLLINGGLQLEQKINKLNAVQSKHANRIKELEAILRDFLTTKECTRTWVDEMQGTIADVLGDE